VKANHRRGVRSRLKAGRSPDAVLRHGQGVIVARSLDVLKAKIGQARCGARAWLSPRVAPGPLMPNTGAVDRSTLIGGPTALIEFAGLRLLTDPTFPTSRRVYSGSGDADEANRPALPATDVLRSTSVLLSHDQHLDNLDHGRQSRPAFGGRGAHEQSGVKRSRAGQGMEVGVGER